MYYLDESNIIGYMREKTHLIDNAAVEEINGLFGDLQSGGDGYINFVYQVVTDRGSYIVKQARPYMQKVGENYELPMDRNHLEYKTIELRRAITPEYLPELYFIDDEFHVFICEDLSNLKVARYQFNKMVQYPGLARKIGDYLAKNNFYTSYLYLEPGQFRGLESYYQNDEMRSIMEGLMFVPGIHLGAPPPDCQELQEIAETFWSDPALYPEGYRLKHLFMQKNQCLIHGDFHTSNLFVGPDVMKVIDMEYTFMGPFSYDLGYMVTNYIAQYCATLMKYPEKGAEALDFTVYLLDSVKEMYDTYREVFDACWEASAKLQYRAIPEFRDTLYLDLIQESAGFASSANISRITGLQGFPDFDNITDIKTRNKAKRLSLAVCKYLLLNRKKFTCVDHMLDSINEVAAVALKLL